MTSLVKKLFSIFGNKKNFKEGKIIRTLKEIKEFYFILTDATIDYSVVLVEKLAYMCISRLKIKPLIKLQTSKELLESWISSAKVHKILIPETCVKLLAVTYLDLSLFFQNIKPSKSNKFVIEALKLTISYKFKTNRGRLLNFLCRSRLSELYIIAGKYDICILCCEKLLLEVQKKLLKIRKKRAVHELAMTSITAFYRIGMCNKLLERKEMASEAFMKAETIAKQYLGNGEIVNELEYEKKLFANLEIPKVKNGMSKCLSPMSSDVKAQSPKTSNFSYTSTFSSRPKSKNLLSGSRSFELIPNYPKKYYNSEKLLKLRKMIESENSEKIITTDQFFYNKMTKKLGIDINDPNCSKSQENHEMQNIQKSEISKLKDRRLYKGFKSEYYIENLDRKIEKLEENCENNLKMQEIKMKSTLKTKVYKNILKTINLKFNSKEKLMPAQRLFFDPPNKKFAETAKGREKIKRRLTIVNKRVRDFNLEIEDQIAQLNKELNNSELERKAKAGKIGDGKLAKSTLKSKIKTRHIKETIHKIFKKRSEIK